MSNVKWIKLSTQMFEDEKIKLIEQMPDADTILIIWVKLLSQAGKANANGYIYLSENIPYTDEMLATVFGRPLNTIRLALETFKAFGMIEIDEENFISIANWEKHQNIEGLDRIREQNRLRKQRQRQRQKEKLSQKKELGHVTSRDSHAPERELELEEELDKERDKDILSDSRNQTAIPFKEIVDYLNLKCNTRYRSTTKKTQSLIKARWNEGFKLDDFKQVIDKKSSQWMNNADMQRYLRPETLFGTKFEGYLNERGEKSNGSNSGRSKQIKQYSDGINF